MDIGIGNHLARTPNTETPANTLVLEMWHSIHNHRVEGWCRLTLVEVWSKTTENDYISTVKTLLACFFGRGIQYN